ncbi:MAG: HIT family protein [Fimbriimonas sp.]
MECPLCAVVAAGSSHPRFLREFRTAILVAGEHQFFPGYCVLIAKDCEREIHRLADTDQANFFAAASRTSSALESVYSPLKMNHAMLGNVVPHLHWHLIPRYASEIDPLAHPWAESSRFGDFQTTSAHVDDLRARLLDFLEV